MSGSEIAYTRMLIGADWQSAAGGDEIEVENPARKTLIARVPRGGAADVERAVAAASSAFEAWRRVLPRERGRQLMAIADGLEAAAEDVARLLASETGNALRTQARPEVKGAIEVFRYFGALAGELKGETVPLGENLLSYTMREPIGVVAAVVPWNAPLQIAALKIAPAISAGNTIVLKAAEDAPLAVLHLAELCRGALPPGAVNVLTGTGPECGAPLVAHPQVRKVAFTGSTEVGKSIMRSAADRIVPVSLELGGKSPSIVFPDVEEDWVVDGVISAMRFTRQGQSCTAGSRLLLHRDIFDGFIDRLNAKVRALTIGDPLDETSDIGALINAKQHHRVASFIERGIASTDARLAFGGPVPSGGPLGAGYFARPTLFAISRQEQLLQREEIFGPVLVAIPWDDESDVLRIANDTQYGLAAYVWSRDLSAALRVAHGVEAGWIQVNQGGGQQLGQSFGGVKQSGIGRECSLEGMLDSYTQRRSVTVNLAIPTATKETI